MSYELSWEPKGAIKRFFGNVNAGEVQAANNKVEGDARFDGLRYVINDFLSCDKFSFDSNSIDEMAAIDGAASTINGNIKIAVVATLPEVLTAATQFADSALNLYPTRIFSTLADARAWIGVR